MKPKVDDSLIGTVVADRYRVTRLIGRGGMGSVYEVAHTRIRKRFALKTLAAHLASDQDALARFRREADIIATLNHPNIVDIVDWDVLDDGSPCMIMERLEGESLAARLRRDGPMSWSAVAAVADPVLSALAVAHRAGVVHRDLKPQNIFIARDGSGGETPKLLDFGVSKIRDSQTFATTDDRVLGTPAYMSPEQAEGIQADVGPATDVWAMGAILFEMITGQYAFVGTNVPSILYRICHGEPQKVVEHRPDAPPALVALLGRVMTRDADQRLTGCDELRGELRVALDGVADLPPVTAPRSIPEVALAETALDIGSAPTTLSSSIGEAVALPDDEPSASRRSRWPLALGGLAVLVGAGVLAVRTLGASPSGPASTPIVANTTPPADAMASLAPVVPLDAAPLAVSAPVDAAPPDRVTVTLDSKPSHASVYDRAGKRLGRTPYRAVVPKGGALELRLERSGYHRKQVILHGDRDHKERVALERKHRAAAPPPVKPSPIEKHPMNVRGKPADPFAKKRGGR